MPVNFRLREQGQNSLYKKRQNRYLFDYKILKLVKNDLTYILGARCADGVVLVADTKITLEDGTRYAYGKKLFKISDSIVMGASGISGFFSSFQNRVQVKSSELTKQGITLNMPARIQLLAEEVIREMNNAYEADRYLLTTNFSVFLASRIVSEADLTHFTGLGIPEPVNTMKVIGHGEPYGALFADKIWDKAMTMEEVARLAIFIIKLIQDTKIDASVGYTTEYLPQIYYIPDVKFPNGFKVSSPITEDEQQTIDNAFITQPIRELTDEEVTCCINEVSGRVGDLLKLFKQGQFKI